MKTKKQFGIFLLFLCMINFISCNKDEKSINYKNSIDGLTADNFPITDCSTSTKPLTSLLAYKLLGIRYIWEVNFMNGIEKYITDDHEYYYYSATDEEKEQVYKIQEKLISSTTHGSFVNLIEDKVELIVASRGISRDEKQYAEEKAVTIIERPIGLDGFIFITNKENRVRSLTSEQIKAIYSGKITNWKEVGGDNEAISPYMRNRNSGSQEKMETLVMQGEAMIDLPEMVGGGMTSPFRSLWDDKNGIAYTPYYYCTTMVEDPMIEILSVNGIAPNKKNISTREYPYTSEIYAAVRADIDKSSFAWKIFEFLTSGEANGIIEESGYIKYY